MARIGTVGRTGATWSRPARPAGAAAGPVGSVEEIPPVRALVVLDGGRREARATIVSVDRFDGGRACSGFVAHLLVATDPTLRPSRLERTRAAAARYAETARRLA
ncbi:hypothetical protein MKK67_26440 [Methylobacterium sp. J-072]|uniref:hypothetical protein n=1 Tax=Methylobacterium sp. J-072 TaxID=2836651 RepID=UPI001FB9EF07|nr:hypothetical protein [Methylobacterium sp. J-072]MCJ2096007.1 hypothetical protein [Methylobacterium sp. J-072]